MPAKCLVKNHFPLIRNCKSTVVGAIVARCTEIRKFSTAIDCSSLESADSHSRWPVNCFLKNIASKLLSEKNDA